MFQGEHKPKEKGPITMIRAKWRYRNKTVELEQPLPIAEGTDCQNDDRRRTPQCKGALLFMAVAVLSCLVTGCEQKSAPKKLATGAMLDICLVSTGNVPNGRMATDLNSGATINLTMPPVITSVDIDTVQRSDDSAQYPSLTVNLTPSGATKLAAATTPAAGQKLAVIANGKVIAVAPVYSPLSKSFQVSGGPIQRDREEIFDTLTK